ncbi:AraC-like DNA-binding protein [Pedobacter cryoconitis]|uniref:AraC-like DNA-binding protein n=2 Tax=Pedobacter cryoconitis TaxID=188932 RepID=A0A7W9DNH3_9SPHI|nr:AraC-like DNA-binding protein [Pedobacter cryoconitis]
MLQRNVAWVRVELYFKRLVLYLYRMVTQDIRTLFEISILEKEIGMTRMDQLNYFQLIYIQQGKGSHIVNGNSYLYQSGKLFFLAPEDSHAFNVESPTRFVHIRFSEVSFFKLQAEAGQLDYCDWMKKIGYIFHNYHAKAGCLFKNEQDEVFGLTLIEGIIREHEQKEIGSLAIIRQSVSILINLIARNIIRTEPDERLERESESAVMKIIAYLQQHIYEPESLKMQVIADEFHLSVNYLGEYFKKRTGESIQEYVINYKLKLVDTRLVYSNKRVKEIAQELNFTDESHLSRIFKKYRGITPGAYRRKHKAVEI